MVFRIDYTIGGAYHQIYAKTYKDIKSFRVYANRMGYHITSIIRIWRGA